MTEEWRPTHHPDYDVSSSGRVRSYAKIGRYGGRLVTPRILKWVFPSHGYPCVSLGRHNQIRVHHLVACAFLGPCPEGQEVMHKDDSKGNPAVSNLEYGTHKQNMKDAVVRGLWPAGHWSRAAKIRWERSVAV